jgi:MoaA/NifB/PqqE/SkfB family radical SAM enzyme
MSKIRIVNWLLTRRCNLKCDYCAIVKDYISKPGSYPHMSHYHKNEMSTETIINGLKAFKIHNPNTFHILYGGEPLLRKDLPDIINFCNENKIFYTIISNNTPEIQPMIKRLFKETDYVDGFTSSVDPIFNEIGVKEDRVKKSIEGLQRLKEIQARGDVKDVVAEITVMNHNKHLLHQLVSELSNNDIYSDITFVDIAKSQYYDFSNIHNTSLLVDRTYDLAMLFNDFIKDDSLLVHMKETLLPRMFDTLPSNLDCEINKSVHNISVDADGTIRLCLRIRGSVLPKMYNLENLFDRNHPEELTHHFSEAIKYEKGRLCKLCNHSCLIMSKYIDDEEDGEADLVHMDKREG